MARARDEPVWLTAVQVKMLHALSLDLFGGAPGVRDEGLLESALGRAPNLWSYAEKEPTLFDLAAAYAVGIAKNHAFVDGNKRASLAAIRAFLFRNGYRFAPDEVETVTMIEGLAGGQIDEPRLAAWIEANAAPR